MKPESGGEAYAPNDAAGALKAASDWETVLEGAVSGVKVLFGRQIALQIVGLFSGIILARILTPYEFGLFALATFFVSAAGLLADLGLGAALVQRKEVPTHADVQTALTCAMTVTAFFVLLLFLCSPLILHFYHDIPAWSPWLIRVMALSLFLVPLRSIPLMLFERELQYRKVALVEMGEGVAFQVAAVISALAGLGVWSFGIAVLARATVGLGLVLAMTRQFPAFGFDKARAKSLLRFGLPLQLYSSAMMLNGAVAPVLIGGLVGPVGLGYVSWAGNLGSKPIQFGEILGRVAFAGYSRLQSDLASLTRAMELTLSMTARFVFPLVALGIILARPLTEIVYSTKWLPAVPVLQLYLVSVIPYFLGVIPARGLIATGAPRTVLYLGLLSTALLWMVAVILVPRWGLAGVPLAIVLTMSLETLLRIGAFRRQAHFKVLRNIAAPVVATGVAALVLLGGPAISSPSRLVVMIAVSAAIYVSLVMLATRTKRLSI